MEVDGTDKLLANGLRVRRDSYIEDQAFMMNSPVASKKPILKNGPEAKLKKKKKPGEVQRLTAISKDIDVIVKQQEASRQFFN